MTTTCWITAAAEGPGGVCATSGGVPSNSRIANRNGIRTPQLYRAGQNFQTDSSDIYWRKVRVSLALKGRPVVNFRRATISLVAVALAAIGIARPAAQTGASAIQIPFETYTL